MRLHRALVLSAVLAAVVPASAEAALFPAPLASAPAPENLSQVVVAPGGSHLYGLAHRGGVAIYARDAAGRPVPAGSTVVPSARALALAPDGRDLYVVAQDGEEDGALTHFSVGADGALTAVGCYGLPARCGPSGFGEYDWPQDVVVSPDGRDLYVLGPGLSHYRRSADGRLTFVGKATGGRLGDAHRFALSPDGRNLYVATGDANPFRESRISHFRRDLATGTMTYAGCVGTDFNGGAPTCVALPAGVVSTAGPSSIAVSPDSRHVYTTGATGSSNEFEGITAVTHFTVEDDGALRFGDCVGNEPSGCPQPPDGTEFKAAGSIAIHPGGGDLYVATSGSIDTDTITHFTLGAGGELGFGSCTGTTPAPACAYSLPTTSGLAASPDGKHLYSVGWSQLNAFSLGSAKAPPAGAPAEIAMLPVDDFGGLNARINPHGARYAVRWEYGPTTEYGLSQDLSSQDDDGDGWVRLHGTLRDLAAGRTYHYRLVVNTPAGPVYGRDGTFTTKPLEQQFPPGVWQHGPLGNDGTGAAFTATVDGSGFPTRYWFEYGETTAYGQTTPVRNLSEADARTHSVRELVTGLTPGRMYFFRIVAENAAGRSVGHGSGLMTYAGPRMGAPTSPPDPSPTPAPTPSPDPSPTPAPSPGPAETVPGPATTVTPATSRTSTKPPAREPRVTVSKRTLVISVIARTRITIERRSGKRWVRVSRVTTDKTLRRTVRPGLYRVTIGAAKRQVRVR